MWRSCFYNVNLKLLLVLQCNVVGVSVIPSTFEHLDVGVDVIAPRTIPKGEAIEAYYGSLVYPDLSKMLLLIRDDGEGTMALLISTFN